MTKKKLQSGDILALPLLKELGYGFAKYINLLDQRANKDPSYPDLINVYNYTSRDQQINLSNLETQGLIFSPLLVSGLRPTITKGLWKVVGSLSVEDNEFILPHYRTYSPPWITDEKEAKEWYYVENADISNKKKSTYENVKHLEPLGASGTGIIEVEATMAFLLKEGKRLEDYFELKEYYERVAYEKVTSMIPYYQLPDRLKGKASK